MTTTPISPLKPQKTLSAELYELSIILPCHNEEQAVQACLDKVKKTIQEQNLNAEIIVVDNGSTDSSRDLLEKNVSIFKAENLALKVVDELHIGYGSAYLKGFRTASGTYIFMADCDDTYDFKEIPHFLNKLKTGDDLVVGNRFAKKYAMPMPWLHRYIGNPLLSFLVKIFFKVRIHDIHCGARAISRNALNQIVLYTRGMEFASEMVIKCAKQGLKIEELPISYHPRLGTSKLRSFSDGWRHLRFILLYSPLVLFLAPGAALFGLGTISFLALYFGNPHIFGLQLYVHPLFLSSLLVIVGYQLILFAGFARTYAITHLGDKDSFLEPLYRKITIEKAGFAGIFLSLVGAIIYLFIFVKWVRSGFGSLDEIKNSIAALTFVTLGIQTFFGAFMFSILGIKER